MKISKWGSWHGRALQTWRHQSASSFDGLDQKKKFSKGDFIVLATIVLVPKRNGRLRFTTIGLPMPLLQEVWPCRPIFFLFVICMYCSCMTACCGCGLIEHVFDLYLNLGNHIYMDIHWSRINDKFLFLSWCRYHYVEYKVAIGCLCPTKALHNFFFLWWRRQQWYWHWHRNRDRARTLVVWLTTTKPGKRSANKIPRAKSAAF